MEDAICVSQAIRGFVGIDLNRLLRQKRSLLKEGSIVDATLIAAPTSTKNSKGERDPDIHSTRNGKQRYFGMKAHIGVDAESGVVHTLVTTVPNAHDVTQTHALRHG